MANSRIYALFPRTSILERFGFNGILARTFPNEFITVSSVKQLQFNSRSTASA